MVALSQRRHLNSAIARHVSSLSRASHAKTTQNLARIRPTSANMGPESTQNTVCQIRGHTLGPDSTPQALGPRIRPISLSENSTKYMARLGKEPVWCLRVCVWRFLYLSRSGGREGSSRGVKSGPVLTTPLLDRPLDDPPGGDEIDDPGPETPAPNRRDPVTSMFGISLQNVVQF